MQVISDTGQFCVIRFGSGVAYLLKNRRLHSEVLLMGEDATSFERLYALLVEQGHPQDMTELDGAIATLGVMHGLPYVLELPDVAGPDNRRSLVTTDAAHHPASPRTLFKDMKPPTHILLIEDDRDIATLLCAFLARSGLRTTYLPDGRGVASVLQGDPPDLILLDLMLPGEHGHAIAQRVRLTHSVPIIMLTALGEEDDRISGLDIGADDYVTKPFSAREVVARINAVLRRSPASHTGSRVRVFRFDGWSLDARRRELTNPDGVVITLTSTEFDLLRALCENAGQVLGRDDLMRLINGQTVEPYDRRVDTLVSRIRQKIEPDAAAPTMIKTVRNGGYVLVPPVEVRS